MLSAGGGKAAGQLGRRSPPKMYKNARGVSLKDGLRRARSIRLERFVEEETGGQPVARRLRPMSSTMFRAPVRPEHWEQCGRPRRFANFDSFAAGRTKAAPFFLFSRKTARRNEIAMHATRPHARRSSRWPPCGAAASPRALCPNPRRHSVPARGRAISRHGRRRSPPHSADVHERGPPRPQRRLSRRGRGRGVFLGRRQAKHINDRRLAPRRA